MSEYVIELGRVIDKFLKGTPDERADCGDSIGNYDDCYYDGYGAAQFDLKKVIDEIPD